MKIKLFWGFILSLITGALLSAPVFAQSKLQIFIAGDSTAATYSAPDQQGWGALLGEYFEADRVSVINKARGGRSSRTFITEGLWDELIAQVNPGDIVIIQFGHNDAGPINDNHRARGSLPGIGQESETIDNQITNKRETVYTFGHYIRSMVEQVKAKQATPVLLSLTQRQVWQQSRIERASAYTSWMYQLALDLDTAFIDVNNLVADKFEALGEAETQKLFVKDYVHFNHQGAKIHAEIILAGMKGARIGDIDALLNDKGRAIPADTFAWLRLPVPADLNLRSIFLIGDSTVRNGRGDGAQGEWGWGDYLHEFINTKKVNLVNRAIGGLSSRTFYTSENWQRTLNMIKPNDLLIIQFGHNDAAPVNDNHRARGTLKGVGIEYQDIINQLTGKPERVHTYGEYLRKFVTEARARGAVTMIASPVPRNRWEKGRIIEAPDSYAEWARIVALQTNSTFIDLNGALSKKYNELGKRKVKTLFADEHTHTNEAGARINAEQVAKTLSPLINL